ncbi:MAG: hypothetical protein QM539_03115 [Alphaproteobacteria bacterium]|nr:hypothetical protein [Alphaproteobacteria bacterium]
MTLIKLLKHNEHSSSQLRDMLKIKHKQHFRNNYLKPAITKGYISLTLPHKPNSRLQKYKLTHLGLSLIIE